jgi:hypothetical protein
LKAFLKNGYRLDATIAQQPGGKAVVGQDVILSRQEYFERKMVNYE